MIGPTDHGPRSAPGRPLRLLLLRGCGWLGVELRQRNIRAEAAGGCIILYRTYLVVAAFCDTITSSIFTARPRRLSGHAAVQLFLGILVQYSFDNYLPYRVRTENCSRRWIWSGQCRLRRRLVGHG